jgi:hypothetical protein
MQIYATTGESRLWWKQFSSGAQVLHRSEYDFCSCNCRRLLRYCPGESNYLDLGSGYDLVLSISFALTPTTGQTCVNLLPLQIDFSGNATKLKLLPKIYEVPW